MVGPSGAVVVPAAGAVEFTTKWLLLIIEKEFQRQEAYQERTWMESQGYKYFRTRRLEIDAGRVARGLITLDGFK